eukprot:12611817-Alexandrium_andersonii.AAC.1
MAWTCPPGVGLPVARHAAPPDGRIRNPPPGLQLCHACYAAGAVGAEVARLAPVLPVTLANVL